jgi:hypothetical protein
MPIGGIEEVLRFGGCENCAADGNVAGPVVGLHRIGCSWVDAERPIRRGLVGSVGQSDKGNDEQEEDEQQPTGMGHADNVMGQRVWTKM